LADQWDALVGRSVNGTFLQTRRFLAYHGDRFVDCSLVVEDAAGALLGVFPAARIESDGLQIDSHPGITHAGLVHDGSLVGDHARNALRLVLDHYRVLGAQRLRYKLIPGVFRKSSSQDDAWAVVQAGARLSRSELACIIDLSAPARLSNGRKDDLRKAKRAGIEIQRGAELTASYWEVLEAALRQRHNSRPVHSLLEIRDLMTRFPQQIETAVAVRSGEVLAGTLLFHFERCSHTQYLASAPEGQALGALTLVLNDAISRAHDHGKRWFSLGASTLEGGTVLNAGLYDWKSSFGATGMVHETYSFEVASTTT